MEYELVYGLPKAEVLAQMAEELTEAAQAALKLRRAMDGANPTPISVDTGMKNLIEELADCQLCEDIFFHGMATQCVSHAYKEIDRIRSEKMERWHMGAFDDRNNWEYYTRAVAKFPNVMYTHAADMAAAYIVGV